jgi:hypothetical protein
MKQSMTILTMVGLIAGFCVSNVAQAITPVVVVLATDQGGGKSPSLNALGHVAWKKTGPDQLWFYNGTTSTQLTLPAGISLSQPHMAKNADVITYFNGANGQAYQHDAVADTFVNVTALAGLGSSYSANVTNDGLAIFRDHAAGPRPLYVSDGVSTFQVAASTDGDQNTWHPVADPGSGAFTYRSGGNTYLYSGGLSGTSSLIGNTGSADNTYHYSDDGTNLAQIAAGDLRYIAIGSGTILNTLNSGGNDFASAISPNGRIIWAQQSTAMWYSFDPDTLGTSVILSTGAATDVGFPVITDRLAVWTETELVNPPWAFAGSLYVQEIDEATGVLLDLHLMSSNVDLHSGFAGTSQTFRDTAVDKLVTWRDKNGDIHLANFGCSNCDEFLDDIIDGICNVGEATSLSEFKQLVTDLIEQTVVSPICDFGESESACEADLASQILNQAVCDVVSALLD